MKVIVAYIALLLMYFFCSTALFCQDHNCDLLKMNRVVYGDTSVMDEIIVLFETDHIIVDSSVEYKLKENLPSGCYFVYYDTLYSLLAIKAYYINGYRYGYWEFFDSTSMLIQEVHYHQNSIDNHKVTIDSCSGLQELVIKYENGRIAYIITFDRKTWFDRVRNGVSINYYKNGMVSDIVHYNNGEMHGYYQKFNDNGTLSKTGYFLMGRKVGLWRTYDLYGGLAKEEHHHSSNITPTDK